MNAIRSERFRMDWNITKMTHSTIQEICTGETRAKRNLAFIRRLPRQWDAPQDVSAATFWKVARKLREGSDVQISNVLRPHVPSVPNWKARNTFDIDFIHRYASARQDIIWGLAARWIPVTLFKRWPRSTSRRITRPTIFIAPSSG